MSRHTSKAPEAPVHPTLPPGVHDPGTASNHHPNPNPDHDNDGRTDNEDPGLDNTGSDTQDEDSDTGHEEYRRSPTPDFVFLPEAPRVEPVKELFPGRRAGEVLSEGIPTMKEYENNLGGPTSNPYSPFNSEIDWEVAKWARLRGPSATSFTELLQINGVCPIHTLGASVTHTF